MSNDIVDEVLRLPPGAAERDSEIGKIFALQQPHYRERKTPSGQVADREGFFILRTNY